MWDTLIWGKISLGSFTLKEAYLIISEHGTLKKDVIWTRIWCGIYWPKISCFLYLIARHRLLTWDHMWCKGYEGPSLCFLCGQEEEKLEHLFLTCPFALKVWSSILCFFDIHAYERQSLFTLLEQCCLLKFENTIVNQAINFILWNWWKERNFRIFRDKRRPGRLIHELVLANLWESILVVSWTSKDWIGNATKMQIFKILNLD